MTLGGDRSILRPMPKRTDKERDAELIKRLQTEAPEALKARVEFDQLLEKIVKVDPSELPKKKSRTRSHG